MQISKEIIVSRFTKIRRYAVQHKVLTGLGLIILLGIGYWSYGKMTGTAGETRYVLGAVERGTIVASITGTGQVSADNQVSLKTKASGDVVYIGAVNGKYVGQGTLIAQLDSRDAQKAVRDAEINLQSAEISLQKLQAPADTLSLLQTENALTEAQTNLEKSYDDGFNTISDTFLDLPPIMSGLQDILYGTTLSRGSQDNISAYSDMVQNSYEQVIVFRDDAALKYKKARDAYDLTFASYKAASRTDDPAKIVALINESYATTKAIADSVKSTNDFINYVNDKLTDKRQTIPTLLNTHLTSLNNYTGETNTRLTSLLNIKNTITNSNFTIAEKKESLAKLKDGADPLDVSSQNLSITQRKNALADAKANLSDYYVYAPFSGLVGQFAVKKNDSVSSGTTVATLITQQQIATISLNEVDIAQVAVGQKVTLSFDAISDLTLTGVVAEIDTIGTVSQGVVTYNVKITFDTQDARIKPGMSVSASIITKVKQDILIIPNSAIKTQNNSQYVSLFDTPIATSTTDTTAGVLSAVAPVQQNIETGLSNDTHTEVISGLNLGEQIIVRTVTSTTKAAASAPSLFGGTNTRSAGTRAVTPR